MKKVLTLIALCALIAVPRVNAQRHDEALCKIIKAMEKGKWDFDLPLFMYYAHKGYSGAKGHWEWHGLLPSFKVTYDEKRSEYGRVFPLRVKNQGLEYEKMRMMNDVKKKMDKMERTEALAAADRNVDLCYATYEEDFKKKSQFVLDLLSFCATKGKGKLKKDITQLSNELTRINEGIAYIHKTGVGYELENVKREKAYIKFNEELDNLVKRAKRLAIGAQCMY